MLDKAQEQQILLDQFLWGNWTKTSLPAKGASCFSAYARSRIYQNKVRFAQVKREPPPSSLPVTQSSSSSASKTSPSVSPGRRLLDSGLGNPHGLPQSHSLKKKITHICFVLFLLKKQRLGIQQTHIPAGCQVIQQLHPNSAYQSRSRLNNKVLE